MRNLKGVEKVVGRNCKGVGNFESVLKTWGGGWAEAVGRSWEVVGIFCNVREDRGGRMDRGCRKVINPPLDYYDVKSNHFTNVKIILSIIKS